jgi:polygalacturonase
MSLRRAMMLVLGLFFCSSAALMAQDDRPLTEPTFPETCITLQAPLRSFGDGPLIGQTVIEQNKESETETEVLTEAFEHCGPNQAVELAFGADRFYNAFLINPIFIPQGISLIIDGGVTVFASRDPRNYQDSSDATCGAYGPIATYVVDVGCRALITMEANSGVYGYGIIDGQGQKPLLFYPGFPAGTVPPPQPYNWWNLTTQKEQSQNGIPNCPVKNCGQASPEMISGGNIQGGVNENLFLYKVTIRNPPYHTVKLGGKYVTVWGVKVQAPWNIPNTDGFDLHASEATIYGTTVANGDQEIALISSGGKDTENITIDHFNGYSKGGITVIASGTGLSNILVQNVNITGDLPSVVPNVSVNGMSVSEMTKLYNIMTYGQALPNATNDLKAIQITDSSQTNPTKAGATISGVTFSSFCVQDIGKPISFVFSPADEIPHLEGAYLQNIHILAPTSQFPDMLKGVPTGKQGGYQLSFVTHVPSSGVPSPNQITLENVIVDDYAPNATSAMTTSIASIDAEINNFTTKTNIYPSLFNELRATGPTPITVPGPPKLTLFSNTYGRMTEVSFPAPARSCPTPFITGDLYLSLGSKLATGDANNLQSTTVTAGDSITLNAIVQPTMSQTTNFVENSYGASPGLLAVGSPAPRSPIIFYEGSRPIGLGILSANGTLATTVVKNISKGSHTYTAQYLGDRFYKQMKFGSVTVQATPPPPAQVTLSLIGPSIAIAGQRVLGFLVTPLADRGRIDREFSGNVTITLSDQGGIVEQTAQFLKGRPELIDLNTSYPRAGIYTLTVSYLGSVATRSVRVLPRGFYGVR